jgi:hypothetical protein
VSLELLEANQGVPSVCDLFDVRQGVITGLNRAFVLPVHAYNKLPKAERQYFRPALLNSTIRDGRLHLTHYLWYPYKSGDKLFRSERDVRETVPMYYDIYLARHKAGLSERRGMKARWWELIWPRLDREGPKIVTTYYGGVGSFAFDADDKYSVVQGYSWYPKSFKTLFESSVSYAYVALLNTNVFIVALSGHARIVGGGQVDLSKRFLAQTPLPSLYDGVDPALVARLIPIGKALSSGESVDRAELESLAKSVYGHG